MSILGNIAKLLFEDNGNTQKPTQGGTPRTTGNRQILVKRNGRYERITFNEYGEIINRSDK